MSAPLPELPHDPAIEVQTEVAAERVHGRMLLVFPYRLPASASRGRRYRLRRGTEHAVRVLMRLGDRTACRPIDAINDGHRFTVALRALAGNRPRRVPDDLSTALRNAGASLDGVSEGHLQQLVFMVAEARDPVIRADRVRAAVDAVRQAR